MVAENPNSEMPPIIKSKDLDRTEEFGRSKRAVLWYSSALLVLALSPLSIGQVAPLLGIEIAKQILSGMLFVASVYYGLIFFNDFRNEVIFNKEGLNTIARSEVSGIYAELNVDLAKIGENLESAYQKIQEFDDVSAVNASLNRKRSLDMSDAYDEEVAKIDDYFKKNRDNIIDNLNIACARANSHKENPIDSYGNDFHMLPGIFYEIEQLVSNARENYRIFSESFPNQVIDFSNNIQNKLSANQFDIYYNKHMGDIQSGIISQFYSIRSELNVVGEYLKKVGRFESGLRRTDKFRLWVLDGFAPGLLLALALGYGFPDFLFLAQKILADISTLWGDIWSGLKSMRRA